MVNRYPRPLRVALQVVTLLALADVAVAAVYKCPDGNGQVTYQSTPCAGGTTLAEPTAPATPMAAPNASEQRARWREQEAALDRRQAARDADAEGQRKRAREQAEREEQACADIRDRIGREKAWLASVSDAARLSAQASIEAEKRKWDERNCSIVRKCMATQPIC